jgi:arylsulfatase
VRADWSLANDLAARQPEKLKELQALFLREAERYQALPLDDRGLERASAALVGRPDLMAGRTSITLAEGMAGMQENVFLDVKNKSVKITAEVEVPQGGGQGTLVAQGGRFGGWSLYVDGGKPAYAYNYLGTRRTTVASQTALPAGKATIELDFAYDGGGPGKGGLATLSVNGKRVAEGRIEQTQPAMFSADETADVGIDLGTPVVESVGAEAKSRFSGKIPRLTVSVRDADAKADAAVREAWQRVAAQTE